MLACPYHVQVPTQRQVGTLSYVATLCSGRFPFGLDPNILPGTRLGPARLNDDTLSPKCESLRPPIRVTLGCIVATLVQDLTAQPD